MGRLFDDNDDGPRGADDDDDGKNCEEGEAKFENSREKIYSRYAPWPTTTVLRPYQAYRGH